METSASPTADSSVPCCYVMFIGTQTHVVTDILKNCGALIFRVKQSFKTLATIYQSTQHNIQEDLNLHKHCSENLPSYNLVSGSSDVNVRSGQEDREKGIKYRIFKHNL
jgi:hypothetical protein